MLILYILSIKYSCVSKARKSLFFVTLYMYFTYGEYKAYCYISLKKLSKQHKILYEYFKHNNKIYLINEKDQCFKDDNNLINKDIDDLNQKKTMNNLISKDIDITNFNKNFNKNSNINYNVNLCDNYTDTSFNNLFNNLSDNTDFITKDTLIKICKKINIDLKYIFGIFEIVGTDKIDKELFSVLMNYCDLL